jgi:8-oxo-dGTP pyrophosphatase MutT (NUDIX family)
MSSSPSDSRPGPGEQLNSGPPVEPRQAASVIVLRDGDGGPEVLLVRRNPNSRFMGGVWVFPGGAVDAAEQGAEAHRAAALRELREEASLTLDGPQALVGFSRWITPAQVSIRFDTYFFVARLPDGQEPSIDGGECIEQGWFAPAAALAAHRAGQLELVFPTIKHLEQLAGFATVGELLDWASAREVVPVEPRVLVEGEVARIVLPGEPGY